MRLTDMNIALAVGLIAGSAIGSVTALEWQRAHEPVPDSVSFVTGAGVESVLYKCDDRHKCPSDIYKRSTHTLDEWHVTPPMHMDYTEAWSPIQRGKWIETLKAPPAKEVAQYWRPVGTDKDDRLPLPKGLQIRGQYKMVAR